MFSFFKKSEKDRLNKQHKKLLKEAFELSKINRTASDEKYAQADAIMKQIEQLKTDH
jgi:hypothetical protein